MFKLILKLSLMVFHMTNVCAIPDFSSYNDVNQKKKAFFEYLSPKIDEINNNIVQERAFLNQAIDKIKSRNLYIKEEDRIHKLNKKYSQDSNEISLSALQTLLNKVDVVPKSLVLAQAANESAWGTSRFAIKGNNLFGQWCFKKGCGIVPNKRNNGMTHEVRSFKSVKDSIKAYIINLNSSNAYNNLRQIRAELRTQNKQITGTDLAKGLSKYSERGEIYVKEIISMIKTNKLEKKYFS